MRTPDLRPRPATTFCATGPRRHAACAADVPAGSCFPYPGWAAVGRRIATDPATPPDLRRDAARCARYDGRGLTARIVAHAVAVGAARFDPHRDGCACRVCRTGTDRGGSFAATP